MHTSSLADHPAFSPGDLDLACALAEARRTAARTLHGRYVYADDATGWDDRAAAPRDARAYYRVYPGGRIEYHAALPPRKRG